MARRWSACKKIKVVAFIIFVVMFIAFLLYFFLPARQEKQEIVEKTAQEGDNNTVTTVQNKEVSIVHIEGLQKGQTTGYLFTVGGILLILLTLGGMGFHYKVLGAPRRLKKDLERERLLDRIHEIEEILVGLGHLKRKRVVVKKSSPRSWGGRPRRGSLRGRSRSTGWRRDLMTRTRRRSRREWFGIMDNGRSVGEIYNRV